MKIYVDFDDVLVDTYNKVSELRDSDQTHHDFIKKCDWDILLEEMPIINNSLEYLKETDLDVSILSKVSTLNEAQAKVKFLRKNGITINIHIVPNLLKKNDIVCAKDNVLIDDKIYNLDNWVEAGGKAIYFNKENKDVDIYGRKNTNYLQINDLSLLMNGIEKYL